MWQTGDACPEGHAPQVQALRKGVEFMSRHCPTCGQRFARKDAYADKPYWIFKPRYNMFEATVVSFLIQDWIDFWSAVEAS
jgi:hypothetical protein